MTKVYEILILQLLDRPCSFSLDLEGKDAKTPQFATALKKPQTFNKNVRSPLSASHREQTVQSISITRANLGTPFSFLHSRRCTFPHSLPQQETLLQKLSKWFSAHFVKITDDLGKYFQSVISISNHLGVHERIHQTVEKSAYELFQRKTQNTMEGLGENGAHHWDSGGK